MKNYKNINLKEKDKALSALSKFELSKQNEKLKIYKSKIAYVNNVYLIDDGFNKYILRESRRGADKDHIDFEIELIRYLNNKGFYLVPKVLSDKYGNFITEKNGFYYILQTFMPGETIGNWDNLSKFDLEKCKELFSTCALLARAVQGFKTELKIENIEVADYVENSFDIYNKAIRIIPKTIGRTLLDKSLGDIHTFMNDTIKEFDSVKYRKLPKQIVHFDLHPGNVNFIDNKITGIFDFDWIRFDSRITDIASTICQSCYFYGGPNGGLYRKDRIQAGLEYYRKTYGKSEFSIQEENNLIRIGLKGFVIFQLLFCIEEYGKNIDDKRSFLALDQFIKLVTLNDYKYLFS